MSPKRKKSKKLPKINRDRKKTFFQYTDDELRLAIRDVEEMRMTVSISVF